MTGCINSLDFVLVRIALCAVPCYTNARIALGLTFDALDVGHGIGNAVVTCGAEAEAVFELFVLGSIT
jgi:hypothetical protein